MKRDSVFSGLAAGLFSCGLLLFIWYIAAEQIDAPLILPTPGETGTALIRNIVDPVFWQHIGATSLRSISAFAVTVLVGTLTGVACGINRTVKALLDFPLAVVRATPVVSFILLALFWFGTSLVPVFVSVLMGLPVMVSSVEAGIAHVDQKLLDCAVVYGFSRSQVVFRVYVPSCIPYFLSGAVSAFGMSWKVVAAGEVLSLPARASGTLLYTAKVHIETADVFAITLVLIGLCFIVENIFAAAVKKISRSGRYD